MNLNKSDKKFQKSKLPILISMGEPSGIGAEICLKLALNKNLANFLTCQKNPLKLVVLGNLNLLKQVAKKFNLKVSFVEIKNLEDVPDFKSSSLCVLNFDLKAQVQLGKLNVENSFFVLDLIKFAALKNLSGKARAMVTAPIHKGIINQAGIKFSGHTEYLQQICKAKNVVMMLASEKMRVALATTHLPLREVADAINSKKLRSVIEILVADLKKFYKIENPKIAICGLNPHAGEDGYLGREELDIINPLVKKMRKEGFLLTNALPADTVFTPHVLADKDAILTMYHDQGLPTLKYKGWDNGVNITLGLPIIRTSPDHGTALNIATQGTSSETSLVAALIEAIQMSE